VRPHASKIMVRFYRAEFSHSLGPYLPSSSSGRHGSYLGLTRRSQLSVNRSTANPRGFLQAALCFR